MEIHKTLNTFIPRTGMYPYGEETVSPGQALTNSSGRGHVLPSGYIYRMITVSVEGRTICMVVTVAITAAAG
jgi:hypothetical protein